MTLLFDVLLCASPWFPFVITHANTHLHELNKGINPFTYLGCGFKYFACSPYLGKIPILTNIFQRGWNHQPHMDAHGIFDFLDLSILFLQFLELSITHIPFAVPGKDLKKHLPWKSWIRCARQRLNQTSAAIVRPLETVTADSLFFVLFWCFALRSVPLGLSCSALTKVFSGTYF